jgi:hypothetical protein
LSLRPTSKQIIVGTSTTVFRGSAIFEMWSANKFQTNVRF